MIRNAPAAVRPIDFRTLVASSFTVLSMLALTVTVNALGWHRHSLLANDIRLILA
jgi:hypothetical protein